MTISTLPIIKPTAASKINVAGIFAFVNSSTALCFYFIFFFFLYNIIYIYGDK